MKEFPKEIWLLAYEMVNEGHVEYRVTENVNYVIGPQRVARYRLVETAIAVPRVEIQKRSLVETEGERDVPRVP